MATILADAPAVDFLRYFAPSSADRGSLIVTVFGGSGYRGRRHFEIAERLSSNGYHCVMVNPRDRNAAADTRAATRNLSEVIRMAVEQTEASRVGIYGRCGGGRLTLFYLRDYPINPVDSVLFWGMPGRFSQLDLLEITERMRKAGYETAEDQIDTTDAVDVLDGLKIRALICGGLEDHTSFLPKGNIEPQVTLFERLVRAGQIPLLSVLIFSGAPQAIDDMEQSAFEAFCTTMLNWFDLTLRMASRRASEGATVSPSGCLKPDGSLLGT